MARPFAGKEYDCLNCGVTFRRSQTEIARGRTKYCSTTCAGEAHSGENNPSWRGGWHLSSHGYKKIRVDGGYEYEHRRNMELHLGRKLETGEDVHHLDGNKQNNSLDNLLLMSARDHRLLHGNQRNGSRNNKAKLDEQQVVDMRKMYGDGETTRTLAELFGVDISNVRLIVRKKTWRHVT